MKLLTILILGMIVIFGGFIIWMNLTPGHFQFEGCCPRKVVYKQGEQKMFCIMLCMDQNTSFEKFIVGLSVLDLYK